VQGGEKIGIFQSSTGKINGALTNIEVITKAHCGLFTFAEK
jgi:hypothetical protein